MGDHRTLHGLGRTANARPPPLSLLREHDPKGSPEREEPGQTRFHHVGASRPRLRCFVLVLSISAILALTVLVLRVFSRKENSQSGIVTLSFNLSAENLFPEEQAAVPREFHSNVDDILDKGKSAIAPLATQVASIAASAVSEVPDIASKVQSAASSAASGVYGAMESIIPRNLSLGTQTFCIGFVDSLSCEGLPLNLSHLLPDVVGELPNPFQRAIQDKLSHLQAFANTLPNVAHIRTMLIVGLTSMLIFGVLFVTSMTSRLCTARSLVRLGYRGGIIITAIVGFTCCVPFFVAAVLLRIFRQKVSSGSSWIEVDHGEVGSLCLGAACCAIVLAFVTAISSAILHQED